MHTYKYVYMPIEKVYVSIFIFIFIVIASFSKIVQEQEHVWQNEYYHENHIEILHLSI